MTSSSRSGSAGAYRGLYERLLRIAVCLLLCAWTPGVSSAGQLPGLPQAAPQTGLVVGQVIDAGTGRPIGGGLVDISLPAAPLARAQSYQARMPPPPPAPSPRIMTGADGRFVFRRLSKGSFIITVAKPGYLEGVYGRRRPGGASQTLVLAEGQKVGGVRVYLLRHAAISGMVIDEAGEPAVGIQIRALLARRSPDAGDSSMPVRLHGPTIAASIAFTGCCPAITSR